MDLKRGDQFEGYILIENIGRGSTAEVWKVLDGQNKQKAIKIFSPSNKLTDFDYKILEQEYDIAKNLDHENILKLEKYSVFDGKPYIVMPLANASLMGELQARMIKYGPNTTYFNESQLASIIYDVSGALDYLESKKMVHRDLKPDNILIIKENDEEKLVIMDFNISKSLKQKILSQTRTISTDSVGLTPAYAAPEFFKGKEHQRSDIFSLGITLAELMTGNIPNGNSNFGPAEILDKGGSIPKLKIKDISPEFSTLISLCLNKDPENRPTAKQLNAWADYFLNNEKWPEEIALLESQMDLKQKKKEPGLTLKSSPIFFKGNETENLSPVHENPYPSPQKTKKGFLKTALVNLNNFYFHVAIAITIIILYSFLLASHFRVPDNEISFDHVLDSGIDNIFRVNIDGKWGLVDINGKELSTVSYDLITKFKNGVAVVVKNDSGCGFINSTGEIIQYSENYQKCKVLNIDYGEVLSGNSIIKIKFYQN